MNTDLDQPKPPLRTACNIDSRGRSIRLISGLLMLGVGLILLIVLALGMLIGAAWWIVAAIAVAGGVFQVYEGWAGWCALRAMGMRTPW